MSKEERVGAEERRSTPGTNGSCSSGGELIELNIDKPSYRLAGLDA